jgi:hypothetical protein
MCPAIMQRAGCQGVTFQVHNIKGYRVETVSKSSMQVLIRWRIERREEPAGQERVTPASFSIWQECTTEDGRREKGDDIRRVKKGYPRF